MAEWSPQVGAYRFALRVNSLQIQTSLQALASRFLASASDLQEDISTIRLLSTDVVLVQRVIVAQPSSSSESRGDAISQQGRYTDDSGRGGNSRLEVLILVTLSKSKLLLILC